MAIGPSYASEPLLGSVIVTTGFGGTKISPTGTTTLLAFTVGKPAILNSVQIVAEGVTTAGNINFWLYDGTTYFLIKQTLVTAITPSASVLAFDSGVLTFGNNGTGYPIPGRALATSVGWTLVCATLNTETFAVYASGGYL